MAAPIAATAARTGPTASKLETGTPAPASASRPRASTKAPTTRTPAVRPATSIRKRRRAMACWTPSSKTRSRAGAPVWSQNSASLVSASVIWTSEHGEQFSAAALNMRFDRPQRQAERLGRLGVREVAAQAERHGRPLFVRQGAQGRGQIHPRLGAERAGRGLLKAVVAAPLPPPRALQGQALLPGDGAEPGAQGGFTPVEQQAGPCGQEGFLGQVVGVAGVGAGAAQEAANGLLVPLDQLLKGPLRAAPGHRDQIGVRLGQDQSIRQNVASNAVITPATVKAPAMMATIR